LEAEFDEMELEDGDKGLTKKVEQVN